MIYNHYYKNYFSTIVCIYLYKILYFIVFVFAIYTQIEEMNTFKINNQLNTSSTSYYPII